MLIQLFHTCLVNEFDPDVGMAVVRVLERARLRRGGAARSDLLRTAGLQRRLSRRGAAGRAPHDRASWRAPKDRSSCRPARAATCSSTSIARAVPGRSRVAARCARAVAARCREFSQFRRRASRRRALGGTAAGARRVPPVVPSPARPRRHARAAGALSARRRRRAGGGRAIRKSAAASAGCSP